MRVWREMSGESRTVVKLVALVATMASLGFASVPFYDWFCRTTGFGGTPLRAESNESLVRDETVTVRFDATVDRAMPWEFTPVQRTMEVRLGEDALAYYEAYNPTDRPIAGTASYNIAPYAAQGYFVKVQCFCFELQVLQPGESVMMPVSFFVDPDILEDNEGKYVRQITLSYTFYETDLPEEEETAALSSDPLTGPAAAAIERN